MISADLPSSVFVYKFEFEGNATTMKDKLKILFEVPLEGNLRIQCTSKNILATVTKFIEKAEFIDDFNLVAMIIGNSGMNTGTILNIENVTIQKNDYISNFSYTFSKDC